MYELKKKIGKVLTSKSVGTGPSSYEKNNLPGRGLTKVEKHWSIPSGSAFKNSTCCSVFMCFIWLSERTAIFGFNNTDCLASIIEMDSVHWAVGIRSLNKAGTALKGCRVFSPHCFPLTKVVMVVMPSEAQALWSVPVSRSLFRRCAGFLVRTIGWTNMLKLAALSMLHKAKKAYYACNLVAARTGCAVHAPCLLAVRQLP